MAMRFAREFTNVAHEPSDKVGGSPRRDSNWTVYPPKGTYLVSDTVSYGWPTTAMALHYGWDQVRYVRIESEASEGKIRSEFDRNRPKGAPASFGAEINRDVRVIGESRSGTVIRLKDASSGFELGTQKPVLSYHLTRCGSNVNYGNMLENLTIDVGRGNPGATGDGLHDDTAAIQRAMTSGKKAVYFTRPAYAIEGTVEVPSSVTLVDGLYAGVVRHKTGRDVAMFRVAGGAAPLFEIRRLYVVGAKLVDHASPREVAVGDVFAEFPQGRDVAMREGFFFPGKFERSDVQWYAYRNAQPDVRKRVYAENCVGFCAQSEPGVTNYLENVELYARSINNERGRKGTAAYAMKSCRAWIYGAKSELCRIAVDLIDSELDMSGFNYLNWDPSNFPEHPVIRAFRSRYAIDGFFWKLKSSQPIVSRDIAADGSARDRLKNEFKTVPADGCFASRTMSTTIAVSGDCRVRCKMLTLSCSWN